MSGLISGPGQPGNPPGGRRNILAGGLDTPPGDGRTPDPLRRNILSPPPAAPARASDPFAQLSDEDVDERLRRDSINPVPPPRPAAPARASGRLARLSDEEVDERLRRDSINPVPPRPVREREASPAPTVRGQDTEMPRIIVERLRILDEIEDRLQQGDEQGALRRALRLQDRELIEFARAAGPKRRQEIRARTAATRLGDARDLIEGTVQHGAEIFKGIAVVPLDTVGFVIEGIGANLQAGRAEADELMEDLRRVPTMTAMEVLALRRKARDTLPLGSNAIYQAAISDIRHEGDTVKDAMVDVTPPLSGKTMDQNSIVRSGQKLRDLNQEFFRAAPGLEGSFAREFGKSIGGGLMDLAMGAIPGVGPVLVTTVSALASAGEAVERGRAGGATDKQLIKLAQRGPISGLAGSAPIEKLLVGIPIPGRRLLTLPANMLGDVLWAIGRTGKQAFVNGMKRGGEQFLQNVIARETFNPDQSLTAGVLSKAGAVAGASATINTGRKFVPGLGRR